jgi:hypothetical protein
VPGRSAIQAFIEFSTPFPNFTPEHREHQATIECKLGHKKDWNNLLAFPIQLGNITSPGAYIAYSNDPGKIAEQDQVKAAAILEQLRSTSGPTSD